jgi:hypothetical protein
VHSKLLWLVFCGCLFPFAHAHAVGSAPFAFRQGQITVEVTLNGYGPARFLVDSGAGGTVVDTRLARALKLKEGWTQRVQGVSATISATRVTGLQGTLAGVPLPSSALALNLRSLADLDADGILGIDFLEGRAVQFDFARRQLRVLSDDERSGLEGETLKLVRRNDCYAVRVGVAGRDAQWLRVDTGCDSAVEWVEPGRAGNTRATVQLGGISLPEVSVGQHATPFFRGERGLLGMGVLGKFRTTIDLREKRLVLQKQ